MSKKVEETPQITCTACEDRRFAESALVAIEHARSAHGLTLELGDIAQLGEASGEELLAYKMAAPDAPCDSEWDTAKCQYLKRGHPIEGSHAGCGADDRMRKWSDEHARTYEKAVLAKKIETAGLPELREQERQNFIDNATIRILAALIQRHGVGEQHAVEAAGQAEKLWEEREKRRLARGEKS